MERTVRTGGSETDGTAVVADGTVDAGTTDPGDLVGLLSVPDGASAAEADAIAAAVHAYLAGREFAEPGEESDARTVPVAPAADGAVVPATATRDREPVGRLRVPDRTTAEETEAIAAAVGAHLADGTVATGTPDGQETEQWTAAARLRRAGTRANPWLVDAAADPWAANARSSREW